MSLLAMLAARLMEVMDGAGPRTLVAENLLEARTMLATRAEKWKRKWQSDALREGLQKGRREGEAAMLLRSCKAGSVTCRPGRMNASMPPTPAPAPWKGGA